MATKRAYVYKDSELFDEYRVFPPVVVLERGDKFQLVNALADHEVLLTIPDGVFEGASIKGATVRKRSKSEEKTPKSIPPLAVEYEVKVDGKKAKGNSDPVIIIDD